MILPVIFCQLVEKTSFCWQRTVLFSIEENVFLTQWQKLANPASNVFYGGAKPNRQYYQERRLVEQKNLL